MNTTPQTITINVSPATDCFRLVHNGSKIIKYFRATGFTRTAAQLFCGTDSACQAEMTRLGFTPVEAPYKPQPVVRRSVTRFAFWSRLTPTEQTNAANSTDPVIKTFLQGLALAQEVDLDLPQLSAALDYATSIELIAAGRKAEILS